jgi:hypothetical protein
LQRKELFKLVILVNLEQTIFTSTSSCKEKTTSNKGIDKQTNNNKNHKHGLVWDALAFECLAITECLF